MRRFRSLFLNLIVIVGLVIGTAPLGLAAITTSALRPGPVSAAAAANTTGERTPGPDLSRRQAKKDHRQKKDRAKKKHKQNKRQQDKRNQTKRKRQQQNQQRRQTQQARELPTGVLPGAAAVAPPAGEPLDPTNRYIVRLREGTGDELAVANDIAANANGIVPTHVYRYVFPGFAAVIPPEDLDSVRNDPRVLDVVQDQVGQADAQILPTGINRIDAEQNPTAKIDGVDQRVNVDVAVVDTAGNDTHEDLNVWAWANCTPSHDNTDDNQHGTHVGGTIGALDNGIGVVGVAPGARLWNIKVMIRGRYLGSWVICGMDLVTYYATDHSDGFGKIEVANGSFGGLGSDGACAASSFHEAFCDAVTAGVTVVVAAGNDTDNAANHVPAAYDQVITVSALADSDGRPGGLGPATPRGPDDSLATFSNFGADIDIAAPGVNILSTVPGGYNGTFSGTSMASPHVAGAAALYKAKHPSATPAQVRAAILEARVTGAIPGDTNDTFDEGVLYVGGSFAAAAAAEASGPSTEDGAARTETSRSDSGKRGKRHGATKPSRQHHESHQGRTRHRR